jgi:hypothetical protein
MSPSRPLLADAVITGSFSVAVFLHALGHSVEHFRSCDGSFFNVYWHFPSEARADIRRYYIARDALYAFGEQHLTHKE